MKPLLHPSSSTILFISMALLMISINTIPTCRCEDDSQYTDCNNAFSCESSILDLKYPFWGGNREQYCGFPNPDMKLTCEGSVPRITIREVKYRILGWDNTTQKLTVARDDYGDGDICALRDNHKNSTFGNTQFQRDDGTGILNVTLLFDCVTNGNLASQIYSTDCADGTKVVYTVAVDPSAVPCKPSVIVVIPISEAQASQLVSPNKLNNALKEGGFELKWSGNNEECRRCVDFDGVCGNDGRGSFTCFCKDGPHTTTCNSERAMIHEQ